MNARFEEQIQSGSETISEAFEKSKPFLRSAMERSREYLDRGRDYYDEASGWLSENRGLAIGAVSAAAGIGLIGYLIGRSGRTSASERISEVAESSASAIERNFSPVFKFLKLYFLYRAKV